MRVADPRRQLAGDEIIERLVGEHADLGVDQCAVDQRAFAGPVALDDRREDADHGIDAGHDVGDRNAGPRRLAIGLAGEAHEAADALRHEVVAPPGTIRSRLPEAGTRAIDQARKFLPHAFVVEAELLQAADLEILDQHVRARGQLLHQPLALRGVEVELDRALAAVGAMEIGGAEVAAVGRRYERRAPAAGVVAGALALDLDHVGAKIGQKLPRPRSRQNAGEFEDAQTGKRTRHRQFSLTLMWPLTRLDRRIGVLWRAGVNLSRAGALMTASSSPRQR